MFDGFWYRCEVKHYSVADEYGDHSHTSTEVIFYKYAVLRETPKGVWLYYVFSGATNPDFAWVSDPKHIRPGTDIFVRGNATKQRACPTKELALADAIARKERHIAGCRARLHRAEEDLRFLKATTLNRPQAWI